MTSLSAASFNIEWLPKEPQYFHGSRKHMKEMLCKYSVSEAKRYSQEQVIEYLTSKFFQYIPHIEKVKFYQITDINSEEPLHFFIVWCSFNLEAREEFYSKREQITSQTGWYPYITGQHIYHHKRPLLDLTEEGLKKAMNKSVIEKMPGLGNLLEVSNFSSGSGTSILLKTTTYDIVLDAGMLNDVLKINELRLHKRKWLFISHSHADHTGGLPYFIKDNKFLIAINPISLELFINAMARTTDIKECLRKDFFYRLTPMWYRSTYKFDDGSSVETVPTYHFPGSMGYLFTFSDKKTLFYSGDLNIKTSYKVGIFSPKNDKVETFDLGKSLINFGIIEANFVGRKIGLTDGTGLSLIQELKKSIIGNRNHLLLTPPNDYGYFLFLHIYHEVISRSINKYNVRIFLDHKILTQLEIIEWRLKRKHIGSLDDGLLKFLEGRKTLAESVKIFDFNMFTEDNLDQLINRNIPGIFILNDTRIDDPSYVSPSVFSKMSKPGLDISRVGKAATKPTTSVLIGNRPITDFDSNEWLLHSSEEMLMNYFLNGPQQFENVYLFHNFKRKLEKFAEKLKEAGYCGRIAAL